MKFWSRYSEHLPVETVAYHIHQSALDIAAKAMPNDPEMVQKLLYLPHDETWFEFTLDGKNCMGVYCSTDKRPGYEGWLEFQACSEQPASKTDTQCLIRYRPSTREFAPFTRAMLEEWNAAKQGPPPDAVDPENAKDIVVLVVLSMIALNSSALHVKEKHDFIRLNKARAAKGKRPKRGYTEIRVSPAFAAIIGREGGNGPRDGALVRRFTNWFWTGVGRTNLEPRVIEPHTRKGGPKTPRDRRVT